MKNESGKGKILIIISIVVIFLLAVTCFIIFKDSFVNGSKIANEEDKSEQIVDENALGEGVNKLDNGVYFKNFTAATIEGETSKTEKRRYSAYLDTGKGSGYYYKLIDNYQDYLNFKTIQPDVIEMTEEYFNEYFMIVTAPYNSNYIGTGLDRIDVFENTLYIAYKFVGDSEDLDVIEGRRTTDNMEQMKVLEEKYTENECISLMVPKNMKKDDIQIYMNLTNLQKDFSNEVKIAYKDDYPEYSKDKKERKEVGFKYFDKTARELLIENMQGNIAITEYNYNYKNSIAEEMIITNDMPEIDFSSWENLGNDYYALRLTDYSEYKKIFDYYDVKKLNESDFECIFATIIVRKNIANSFIADEVTVDANGCNLKITTGGALENNENLKYPAMIVFTPNYMNLEETNLKITVD